MVPFNQTILKAVSGGIASYAGRTISILSFNSYKQRKKIRLRSLVKLGFNMSSIKDIFNESNQAKVAEIAFCASRLSDEITDYKFEDTMQGFFFFPMDFFFLVKLTMPWLDRKISQNHDKPEIYKT